MIIHPVLSDHFFALQAGAPGVMNGPFGGGFSPDSHTRVAYSRKPGYFERVGGSFCGSFFGFGVLFAAVVLLFYNEVGLFLDNMLPVVFGVIALC